MLHPDGKVEIGHWKRDRLVEPARDKEDYVDATQSWLMPDRHKPASVRGVPTAEVIGPSEVPHHRSSCAVCRVPCAVCRVPCAVCRVPCAV
jgi:hypothetical protein